MRECMLQFANLLCCGILGLFLLIVWQGRVGCLLQLLIKGPHFARAIVLRNTA